MNSSCMGDNLRHLASQANRCILSLNAIKNTSLLDDTSMTRRSKRSGNRSQDNVYISEVKFRQIRIHESAQPILKRLSIEKSNYQSNAGKLSNQSRFWHNVAGNSRTKESQKVVPAFTVWP